jgi:hypothetical protein
MTFCGLALAIVQSSEPATTERNPEGGRLVVPWMQAFGLVRSGAFVEQTLSREIGSSGIDWTSKPHEKATEMV